MSHELSDLDASRFRVVSGPSVPVILAFVAAYVDVIFFLELDGTFVAFITGTMIVMFTDLVQPDGAKLNKVAVLPVFVLSVSFWALAIKAARARGYTVILHHTLVIQGVALGATLLLAVWCRPITDPDSWPAIAVTSSAVFAMALQTTAMVMLLHFHTPTTMMTGNLARLVVDLVNAEPAARYWAGSPPKQPRSIRIGRFALAIVRILGRWSGGRDSVDACGLYRTCGAGLSAHHVGGEDLPCRLVPSRQIAFVSLLGPAGAPGQAVAKSLFVGYAWSVFPTETGK